jgi:threonine/homoserine/homoserine lactone efflux protein
MDALLTAYLGVTMILVATPGATTAVVVRSALTHGRTGGLAAATGAAMGNLTHAALAGYGLAVLVATRPAAMAGVRIVGAAYLAWLGVQSFHRAVVGGAQRPASVAGEVMGIDRDGRRGRFREGFTTTLLNPATATFYLAVVPAFLPLRTPWWFAALAAIHVAMAFTCHGAWAVGIGAARHAVSASARCALEAAAGIALLWLATRVVG